MVTCSVRIPCGPRGSYAPTSSRQPTLPKQRFRSDLSKSHASQATKELVQLVGGVEVGLEFTRGELFAEVIEFAREKVE